MRYRRAALALLSILFAVNVYRAVTQAITVDEAFAYLKLMNGPPSLVFTTYDACHHVLYTYLARISIAVFGVSAIALRLPALLAGLLYFSVVYRFCRWLSGDTWRLLLGVALLSLNPLVLDFLVAARGYGMALAFLLLAFYEFARFCASEREANGGRRLTRSGLWLSASIAANLTMLFPALALMVLAACVVVFLRRGGWLTIQRYLAAVIVPAFLLMVLPFSHAARDNFYYGLPALFDSLRGLAAFSTGRAISQWVLLTLAAVPIAVFAAALKQAISTRFAMWNAAAWTLLISSAGLWITMAGLIAAHDLFRVPYPAGRTGLYLILLFLAQLLSAIEWALGQGRSGKWTGALLGVCASAMIVLFAGAFRVTYFAEWDFCRELKPMLAALEKNKPAGKIIRVAGSFEYETCVNFYRIKRDLGWMQPMSRAQLDSGDFYLYTGTDWQRAADRHLRVLYADPLSHAVLAAP